MTAWRRPPRIEGPDRCMRGGWCCRGSLWGSSSSGWVTWVRRARSDGSRRGCVSISRMPNDLRRTLPLTVLLAAACASDGGESSTAATTGSGATSDGSPLPTSSMGSTGDTSGTTDAAPDCSASRLRSRWTLPEKTTCFGVAMDDGQGVTVLAGEDDSDSYKAVLHRFVAGALVWSIEHPPPDDHVRPHALALRGDGVAVVTGFSADPTPGSFESVPWTVAYDATGALLWEHVDTSGTCDQPPCRMGKNRGVVVTAGGEFLVGGERGLYGDVGFDMTYVLRRYDASMGEVELHEYPTPFNDDDDVASALALRPDGGVIMMGQTHNMSFTADLWLARLSGAGALERVDTFAAGDDDVVQFVTAMSDGSAVYSALADGFYAARIAADLAPVWHLDTDWYGPVLAGPGDVVFAAVDDQRVVDKLDAAGERQWAADECLAGEGASALGLSPDGAQLLVCRSYEGTTVVEIYDAT